MAPSIKKIKMQINGPILKIAIRLLILMILFVMLFMISSFLYSAKYWPDVYNYINANITIKHIAKLSDLNITELTVTEKTEDNTRDIYYYTIYDDFTEIYLDYEDKYDEELIDYTEKINKTRTKRHIKIDDILEKNDDRPRAFVDYVFPFEDYETRSVDVLEEDDNLTAAAPYNAEKLTDDGISKYKTLQNLNSTVSPWIATIFIRANDSNQFTYYCDGAVIANTAILTAARCVNISNVDDLIVILGKKSLQISVEGETVHKVKQIKQHENFTATNENHIENDLAVLYLEDPAVFTNTIQPVTFGCGARTEERNAVTTAWALSGELEAIVFEKETRGNCAVDEENQFCATYGDDVPLCPSYGGLYLTNISHMTEPTTETPWCLQGIRSADPSQRGVCFDKTITYTNLSGYRDWILNAIGK